MEILVAEDDTDTGVMYKNILEDRRGHQVIITSSGENCVKVYNEKLQNVEWEALHIQPFDAVILDYKMQDMDGIEVAKEILEINPQQRIIFASAYVRDSLEDMVKQLKQVVELLQKPFEPSALVDTIEDKEIYEGLEKLNADIELIKDLKATHEQLSDLLEGLRKLQKGRTF